MTERPKRPLPPGALLKIDHRRMCDLVCLRLKSQSD